MKTSKEELVKKRGKVPLILGIIIIISVAFLSAYISYNIFPSEEEEIDNRFNEVLEEVESYGGAVIYTYDKDGNIIDKRSALSPSQAVLKGFYGDKLNG